MQRKTMNSFFLGPVSVPEVGSPSIIKDMLSLYEMGMIYFHHFHLPALDCFGQLHSHVGFICFVLKVEVDPIRVEQERFPTFL